MYLFLTAEEMPKEVWKAFFYTGGKWVSICPYIRKDGQWKLPDKFSNVRAEGFLEVMSADSANSSLGWWQFEDQSYDKITTKKLISFRVFYDSAQKMYKAAVYFDAKWGENLSPVWWKKGDPFYMNVETTTIEVPSSASADDTSLVGGETAWMEETTPDGRTLKRMYERMYYKIGESVSFIAS